MPAIEKFLKQLFSARILSFAIGSFLILFSPFLIYTGSAFSSSPNYPSTLFFAFAFSIGIVCSAWPLIRELTARVSATVFQRFLRLRGTSVLALLISVTFLQSWLIVSVMTSGVGAILYENVAGGIYLGALIASFALVFVTQIMTVARKTRFLFFSILALVLSGALSILTSLAILKLLASSPRPPSFFATNGAHFFFPLALISTLAATLFFTLESINNRKVVIGDASSGLTIGNYSIYNFMFLFGLVNLFSIFFFDVVFPLRFNSVNTNVRVLVFLPGDQFQNLTLILSFLANVALLILGAMRTLTALGARIMEGVFGSVLVLIGIRAFSLTFGNLVGDLSVTSVTFYAAEELANTVFGSILVANSIANGVPILASTLTSKSYAKENPGEGYQQEDKPATTTSVLQ